MLMNIRWTEHELAYLLDNCIKIIRGVLSKEEAAPKISTYLRARAIAEGKKIDPDSDASFRNEAAISRQLEIMRVRYLGLASSYLIPQEVVNIIDCYRYHRDEFEEILHSPPEKPEPEPKPEPIQWKQPSPGPAWTKDRPDLYRQGTKTEPVSTPKSEPASQPKHKSVPWPELEPAPNPRDVRQKFLSWLTKRESLESKENPQLFIQRTMKALDTIDARCLEKRLLKSRLYEITDTKEIYQLTEKIVLNPSILKIPSKRVAYILYNALENYYAFLASRHFEPGKRTPVYVSNTPVTEATFLAFLNEQGLRYIDKRNRKGALWIKGGHELNNLVKYCRAKFGIRFVYNRGTARTFPGSPSWWTRDYVNSIYSKIS